MNVTDGDTRPLHALVQQLGLFGLSPAVVNKFQFERARSNLEFSVVRMDRLKVAVNRTLSKLGEITTLVHTSEPKMRSLVNALLTTLKVRMQLCFLRF